MDFLERALRFYGPVWWVLVEAAGVVAVVVLAFANPRIGARFFEAVERRLARLARRPAASVILVALVALLGRAALLPVLGIPEPNVRDEFSYLLAAETFAAGRMTNPPHPMWVHFEVPFVLHQPTYMSAYPPAQGFALAIGKVIAGQAWVGVWLSVGVMCGTVVWMLRGWLPPGWALLGGLLVAIRLGVFSYWMNSYWGGAVPAIGGCLVLGALPRVLRRPKYHDAALMAAGVVILAHSRPFEGMILSLTTAAGLTAWFLMNRRVRFATKLRRVVLPAACVFIAAALATGFYFWSVTGSPTVMPYVLHNRTYGLAPPLILHTPAVRPEYRHRYLAQLYDSLADRHLNSRTLEGAVEQNVRKFRILWPFYLGPALSLPLIFLPWAIRDRRIRYLVIVLAVMFTAVALELTTWPHYLAPVLCAIVAVVIQSMRHCRHWSWRGRPSGLFIVRTLPAVLILLAVLRAFAPVMRLPYSSEWDPWYYRPWPRALERGHAIDQLQRSGGRDLVIVRNGVGQHGAREWVYNDADIDASDIVWARDMGPAANEALIRYYADRRVWLAEPDIDPPRLSPYPTSN
jgi:hypothetical protein